MGKLQQRKLGKFTKKFNVIIEIVGRHLRTENPVLTKTRYLGDRF